MSHRHPAASDFGRAPDVWLVTGIPGAGKTTTARWLAEFIEQLAPLRLQVVVLAPGVEVALARDLAGPEKTVDDRWAYLAAVIADELRNVGWWLDNRAGTPDEVVTLLLANVARAA